jgi:DNA-binding MarR family transcriptional regulator
MQKEIYRRLLAPCAWSQVHRFATKLSSLYDGLLSPEGLTITQYSLLEDIERAGQLSHAVLAEKVGMDRTTLTRNLRPLTRARWVTAGIGKDRRQRLLQLTAAGRRKLLRSFPLWEEAQRQFLSQIGIESLQELRTLLTSAESAVTKAFPANPEKP